MPRYVRDESMYLIDYDAAVKLMDDDLREKLYADMSPCTDQEFYNAYCEAHALKHGIAFIV